MRRILIFGNSGSGKTTLARSLSKREGLPHLDLDLLAWEAPGVRRPIADSTRAILEFVDAQPQWVIEGCYAGLLEIAVPFATELQFLNPGVAACVRNCRRRSWEPEKYATLEEQDAKLEFLLDWVRDYAVRTDEYSLARHRAIFDGFQGTKQEIRETRG